MQYPNIQSVENTYQNLFFHAIKGSFLTHLTWIILFIWMDVPILIYFNILSCCLYVYCYIIVQKRLYKLYAVLTLLEILVMVYISTVVLGWEPGFHYFIFILIYGAFFIPNLKTYQKIMIVFISLSLYLVLNIYSTTPYVILDNQYMRLLKILNIIYCFILIGILSSFFRDTIDKTLRSLHENNQQLQIMASTDPLTGLYNRRTMYSNIKKEINHYHDTGETFSIVIADIDNFKMFNDRFGHDCGDKVLIQCAKVIREELREYDSISRWGGEEFLILLHAITEEEAYIIAEKIRQRVNDQIFTYLEYQLTISLTLGLAIYDHQESLSDIVNEADQALLIGKEQGKNIVKTYSIT